MINIERAECPPQLIDPNPDGDAWSRLSVRKVLWDMQHEKCCYCEDKILLRGPTQNIEHYFPKNDDMYPHLKNDWDNLLHSCADCNQTKKAQFPLNEDNIPLIINPSNDNINPEDHITFNTSDDDLFALGLPLVKNDSEFGENSIKILKLDIDFKCFNRVTYYKNILFDKYIELYLASQSSDDEDLHIAKDNFERLLS